MKRALMVGIIILPAALLIAVVVLTTPASATHDQVTVAINNYLQYRAPRSISIGGIQRLVPAVFPGRFTPQMSQDTFGGGNYFKSDFHPTNIPLNYLSQKPLPYPPSAVWCIRLRPADNLHPEIVFVALHEDDYHTEWIVHDPAATGQELNANLVTLGCSEIESP